MIFQIAFCCQISNENGNFNFLDVVDSISRKMINRHPHVFSKPTNLTLEEQQIVWEKLKAKEKRRNQKTNSHFSHFDDIPINLPALMRSFKIQKIVSRVGFDWPKTKQVYEKVLEELKEVRLAKTKDNIEEEIGDLLFSVVNLARHLETDPEGALRRANSKFEKRFKNLETELFNQGKSFSESSIEELEKIWSIIKNR